MATWDVTTNKPPFVPELLGLCFASATTSFHFLRRFRVGFINRRRKRAAFAHRVHPSTDPDASVVTASGQYLAMYVITFATFMSSTFLCVAMVRAYPVPEAWALVAVVVATILATVSLMRSVPIDRPDGT